MSVMKILKNKKDLKIDDLKEEPLNEPSIEEFVKYMRKTIKKRQLKKRDILYLSDIPVNYGYKILLGEKRTKQRDIIIRICLVSEFTLGELEEALRLYEMPILYKKFLRDKLIMDAFRKNVRDVDLLNETLIKNKVSPLKSCGA